MDLAILAHKPLRPDKQSRVVNNPFDLALLRHAKYDVQAVLPRYLFDLPLAGSGNRLC